MTKRINDYALLLCILLFSGCTSIPIAPLYLGNNNNRISSGSLNQSTYDSLKKFLRQYSATGLKDTLIIKYDYNNESCWEQLDLMNYNYVQEVIASHSEKIKRVMSSRANVSVFDFREPGSRINNLKRWDRAIIIDSSKVLLNLVFKERTRCGNSIIVLPDKQYLFLRSDSHSEALDLSQAKIAGYLSKK